MLNALPVDRWADDLLRSGQVETEEAAQERIAALQAANPRAAKREISKRYKRVKREFLQKPDFDGRQFLHPNARDLIDRIVALGVGTIVLDECHHLLDYWAFILRELIRELPGVQVVGLTATLPDTSNQNEFENYDALLGEVDFEVPTPAVVKEGNLAPYRDLVYFCEPSRREMDYLRRFRGILKRPFPPSPPPPPSKPGPHLCCIPPSHLPSFSTGSRFCALRQ